MTRPARPVRVLVAEDSATSRELLVSLLESDPQITVIGRARNGLEAVEMTKSLSPALIVMDINMPVMDGFEATRQIMVEAPTPIVIVTAGFDPADVAVSLRAVELGALTVLPTPSGPGSATFGASATRLVSTVKAMADVKVVRRRWWSGAHPPAAPAPLIRNGTAVRVVAVAASTGGPAALHRLLAHLPRDFEVPVVVVQHIAEGFAPGLVKWLNSATSLRVTLAREGEQLVRGAIYIAPDRLHLEVTPQLRTSLSDSPPVGGFRPAATVLFRSVARSVGKEAAAVVLTGMGSDGLPGIKELREAKGRVLVQDESTSVVFGMPGVVARAGLADLVAPIDLLAAELVKLTSRRTP